MGKKLEEAFHKEAIQFAYEKVLNIINPRGSANENYLDHMAKMLI